MKISGTVSYEYLNPSSKMIFRLIFNGEFMNYENACGGLMEDNASWYFQVNINECNFSPDRIQYIFSMLESLVCSVKLSIPIYFE